MPLYEYVCEECRHPFEMLLFAGEEAECPQCHGKNLEKQFSLPGKPATEGNALPMACRSPGPPCGPVCSRWSQN